MPLLPSGSSASSRQPQHEAQPPDESPLDALTLAGLPLVGADLAEDSCVLRIPVKPHGFRRTGLDDAAMPLNGDVVE